MEQIELIIIVIIILAIVFKIIKIFKYFMMIFFLIIALKLLGGFDNPSVVEFNNKYQISQTLSKWNEQLGLAGKIEGLFDGTVGFFKEEIEKVEKKSDLQECQLNNVGNEDNCQQNKN